MESLGTGSVTYWVMHQPVFLLGGFRALLLQLADWRVAQAVADHSDVVRHPWRRLVATVDTVTALACGEPAEVARATRWMRRSHAGVRGEADGRRYDAADVDARWWVLATLVDTVLVLEERFLGELGEEDRRRYYREVRWLAPRMGIPPQLLPADLTAFRRFMQQRMATLQVEAVSRQVAQHVLYPSPWPTPLLLAPLRWLTAELLPVNLRTGFGLPLGAGTGAAAAVVAGSVRQVVPRLPTPLRTFPLLHPLRDRRWWWEEGRHLRAPHTPTRQVPATAPAREATWGDHKHSPIWRQAPPGSLPPSKEEVGVGEAAGARDERGGGSHPGGSGLSGGEGGA